MDGVDEPKLLIEGVASPHGYALRPSEAELLEEAEVVFWVGPQIETFLDDALPSLAHHADVVRMDATDGLTQLEFREGGVWAAHDHDHGDHDHGDHDHDDHAEHDHDHEDHAEHDHDDHAENDHDDHDHAEHDHDHDHEDHAEHDHGDEHADHDHDHEDHAEHAHDDHDHAHGAFDAHIWMDPENAKVMVGAIVAALSEHDPDHADAFAANGEAMISELDELSAEIEEMLEPVLGEPFIVFHDAYQYFEARYGLAGVGSITLDPEIPPGAGRVSELREIIEDRGAVCVFSEPQFAPRIVTTLIDGTDVDTAVLDPLGANIAPGTDHYAEMMRANARAMVECLGGTS
ncbi:MAG: zinc ABC transporter substrate-binding protein [Pseudomonadota bacterium]